MKSIENKLNAYDEICKKIQNEFFYFDKTSLNLVAWEGIMEISGLSKIKI